MPLDHSRPPVPSSSDSAEMTLAISTSDGLWQLCSQLNVPPLAVFLAAFSTVLFRYAGQEMVVVGAVSEPSCPADEFPAQVLFPIKTRA